ncbi:MAG TPA: MazG family protein [Candidatus Dormibacteraeota bacterium]
MTDADFAQLRRLFEVMARLRAPGGCPWDMAQTHRTLAPFLLEETYEAIQAAEEGNPVELAEELGDLLVEVAMQVAIGAEAGEFDVGTVAEAATEKMVGRHPHVFGDVELDGVDQVLGNWEELKRREKPHRQSALDGIPRALPALALAAAIQRRQDRDHPRGEAPDALAAAALSRLADPGVAGEAAEALVGELLYSLVAVARARGVDAEAALRRHAAGQRQSLRQAEVARRLGAVPASPADSAEASN